MTGESRYDEYNVLHSPLLRNVVFCLEDVEKSLQRVENALCRGTENWLLLKPNRNDAISSGIYLPISKAPIHIYTTYTAVVFVVSKNPFFWGENHRESFLIARLRPLHTSPTIPSGEVLQEAQKRVASKSVKRSGWLRSSKSANGSALFNTTGRLQASKV